MAPCYSLTRDLNQITRSDTFSEKTTRCDTVKTIMSDLFMHIISNITYLATG